MAADDATLVERLGLSALDVDEVAAAWRELLLLAIEQLAARNRELAEKETRYHAALDEARSLRAEHRAALLLFAMIATLKLGTKETAAA